jgi:DnaJ family protein C protein 8
VQVLNSCSFLLSADRQNTSKGFSFFCIYIIQYTRQPTLLNTHSTIIIIMSPDSIPLEEGEGGVGPSTTSVQNQTDTELQHQQEEDPLEKAKREQEELERALEEAKDVNAKDDPGLKAFYADMKQVDRENQVNMVLGAFKLNPYEMLGLRFDTPVEDVSRAYRKVSLAVHPDKCPHPRAKDAFEIIGHAQKELLDPEKKSRLDLLLNTAKESVVQEWKKSTKKDAATQLAVALHGMDSVMDTWMASDEFHEAWKTKGRDILAKTEWRKRKLAKRVEEETERAKEESKKRKEEIKSEREMEKNWEQRREGRVDNWRSFMNKKSKKNSTGLRRPPKMKH